MAVHYADERLTMRKPLSIWAGDWEVAVLQDTWIQMETEEHALGKDLPAHTAPSISKVPAHTSRIRANKSGLKASTPSFPTTAPAPNMTCTIISTP